MVLVMSAPRTAARKRQAIAQRSSWIGVLNPWTKAAITPAAAGVGRPTKFFEPPGAMPCTLKRARRQAQQIRKARQQIQPNWLICSTERVSWPGRLRTPQAYAIRAGA